MKSFRQPIVTIESPPVQITATPATTTAPVVDIASTPIPRKQSLFNNIFCCFTPKKVGVLDAQYSTIAETPRVKTSI